MFNSHHDFPVPVPSGQGILLTETFSSSANINDSYPGRSQPNVIEQIIRYQVQD
jgi:hypothetical protein